MGISIASAIHMTILKSNDTPASTKISAIAIANTSNFRPSSASHISSKLLSVTSSHLFLQLFLILMLLPMLDIVPQ